MLFLTWYGCEGTISDCNFINNTADNGAAYRLEMIIMVFPVPVLTAVLFINNTASNQGGAVYEGGKQVKLLLDIKIPYSPITLQKKKEGSAIYSGYTFKY